MSDSFELKSIKKDIIETRKLIKEKEKELDRAADDEQVKYKLEIHKLRLQLKMQKKRYLQLKEESKNVEIQNESLLDVIINNPPF